MICAVWGEGSSTISFAGFYTKTHPCLQLLCCQTVPFLEWYMFIFRFFIIHQMKIAILLLLVIHLNVTGQF